MSELTEKAIQEIAAMESRAKKPETIHALSNERQLVAAYNGELVGNPRPIPARAHTVNALCDLTAWAVRAAKTCVDGPDEQTPAHTPAIYHGPEAVVLILDHDGYRCDRVTLDLPQAEVFQLLCAMAFERNRAAMGQKEVVDFLRVQCERPDLAAPFRSLTWARTDQTAGTVQHGRESLGHGVEAEVAQATDIPEELRLTVPVYDVAGERNAYGVGVLVTLDTTAQTVRLSPSQTELRAAVDDHQADIRTRIGAVLSAEEVDLPVYYGSP